MGRNYIKKPISHNLKKSSKNGDAGTPPAQAQPPQDDRMHRGFVALPV